MGLPKPREADVLRACLDWLALHKIMSWRNNTTGVYDPTRKRFRAFAGLRGVADILGCVSRSHGGGGRLLAVECKSATGKLSPDQESFLDAVRAAGGLAFVVRDVCELEAALAAEGVIPQRPPVGGARGGAKGEREG